MMSYRRILLVGLLLSAALVQATSLFGDLKNTEWTRTIQLTSQLARHDSTITVENTGSTDVSAYYLAVLEPLPAYIKVTQEGSKLSTTILPDKQTIVSADGQITIKATMIKVDLAKPLKPSATTSLKVVMVFGHAMEPYPQSISQSERQLVRFRDNHFVLSPYPTTKLTTTVKLASSSIQTSSQLQPTTIKGDTITYGPYENLKPFSHSPMMIHFENQKPFLSVVRLNREIDISHWGRVSIEESHHWRNDGAELKGGFSRYEYQINPMATGHSAIKEVTLFVPKNAEDVWYRDAIGNISTSHWHDTKVQLQPRFPLFGGWQTKFCWGYLIPTEQVLFYDVDNPTRFTLNITFGPHFEEDVIIDYQRVLVFLPEGATDIDVKTPFPVKQSFETRITTLDLHGRPVVVLEKENLINQYNRALFQVSYTYNTTSIYRKPLSIAGALFVTFVALMFLSRFSLTILPKSQ